MMESDLVLLTLILTVPFTEIKESYLLAENKLFNVYLLEMEQKVSIFNLSSQIAWYLTTKLIVKMKKYL